MQLRLKNKICLTAFILFLLPLFASRSFAAEYRQSYKFEKPNIITLSNGRQILEMKGAKQKDDIVGAPILPVKRSKIFVPANEKVVSIEIVYGTLKTIEGSYVIQHATTPYPISYKGGVIVDKPAPNIYENNTIYPSSVHKTRKPQFLHGVKIVWVDLMPVLYNPVGRQLKYYEELGVRITTEKQKRPDWVMPFRNFPKNREKILSIIENKTDFLNLHPSSGKSQAEGTSTLSETPLPAQGERQYVVITTESLVSTFSTLTDYRSSAGGGGYTTHVEDIANIAANYPGVDLAEQMRNFIKDMYINYGTQYVVLGGDCDGPPGTQTIPTRGCYAVVGSTTDANIPSDLYFGCLDGTWNGDNDAFWGETNDGVNGGDIDWLPEVYVGRIPADDAVEVMNQINKIIAFETGNRPNKTLLVGENLDSTPTWGGDRMDWVYSYMDSTPKTELYDRDHYWSKLELLSNINSDAYHWINHLGHSNVTYNMKLSNSDVASMTNNQYFFVYTQGCYSGAIDSRSSSETYGSTDCIGETIVNGYNDGGAFAYIGNSRYGWYNPGTYVEGASNRVHKEFVEAVFTDHITKLGAANQISKTDLDLSSGLYRWIAFETNLLGCPATDLAALGCLSDAECDDGVFCNGTETCTGGACQSGTPVDCSDVIECTYDSCDKITDTCKHTPSDAYCDDGNICTTDSCTDTGCVYTWPDCGTEDGCCGSDCISDTDPDCTDCGNGLCEAGETCNSCGADCITGAGDGTCSACFKGKCDGVCHPVKEGPDCSDCAPSYCCGDGVCEGGENSDNCAIDCGAPPPCDANETSCDDGVDNDCDTMVDCADPECSGDPACICDAVETSCTDGVDNDCDGVIDCDDTVDCSGDPACDSCGAKGSPCDYNSDCCSGRCHSKKGVCL